MIPKPDDGECLFCAEQFPTEIHLLMHMAQEHPGWDQRGYLESHPVHPKFRGKP